VEDFVENGAGLFPDSGKTWPVNGLNVAGEAPSSPTFAPKSGIDNHQVPV
jgi:hypothetical protein